MYKETLKTSGGETLESAPSRECWFRRNRGKIALILGMGLGANATNIVQGARSVLRWGEYMTRSYLENEPEKTKKKKSFHSESWKPSLCEIREGTFLEDDEAIDEYCKSNDTDPIFSSCSMSHRSAEVFEFSEYLRSSMIITQCDGPADDRLSGISETCDVGKNGSQRSELLPETLENISDSYLFLLKEFDPEAFAMIKRNILFEDGLDLGGPMGTASGPYSIICGQLTDSPYGRFYYVDMKEKLGEVNFQEMLAEKDEEALGRFFRNLTVLTHESLGHVVFDMEAPESNKGEQSCMEDVILNLLGNELYAYYIGAKMVDFMSHRYPVLNRILEHDENRLSAIESHLSQMDSCDPHASELADERLLMLENGVGFEARMLIDYRQAMESGDWRTFKELIIKTASPFTEWMETKYTLDNHKHYGETEKYNRLSNRLNSMMGPDSPEKFLKE